MLAVEEGLKSPTGDIFNEVPDRIADVIILVGAGHAATSVGTGLSLGWMAALAAVFTAYVRVFGGSLGLTQHFIGPMAKQHRMFTLTLATLVAAIEAVARPAAARDCGRHSWSSSPARCRPPSGASGCIVDEARAR